MVALDGEAQPRGCPTHRKPCQHRKEVRARRAGATDVCGGGRMLHVCWVVLSPRAKPERFHSCRKARHRSWPAWVEWFSRVESRVGVEIQLQRVAGCPPQDPAPSPNTPHFNVVVSVFLLLPTHPQANYFFRLSKYSKWVAMWRAVLCSRHEGRCGGDDGLPNASAISKCGMYLPKPPTNHCHPRLPPAPAAGRSRSC